MSKYKEDIPIVYIIDRDRSVRNAMKRLLQSAGMNAKTFASVNEFLKCDYRKQNSCLVVDVNRPGDKNIDLAKKLKGNEFKIPIIFVSCYEDDKLRNSIKEIGASGLFRKPIDDLALLDAIQWALKR